MKRAAFFAALACAGATCMAQSLNITQGNITYSLNSATAFEAFFDGSTGITVDNKHIDLAKADRIWVDGTNISDAVEITYNGTTAHATVAGNIASLLEVTIEGANVSIAQSDDTASEITYRLKGSSENGSFAMEGSYKATVELAGLTLTNPNGAALDIQNGKRINLTLAEGTVNALSDGTEGKQKGCIVCKGHLEFKGNGSLTVAGNTAHAIYAKEYVEVKDCDITVTSAVKDGVNCAQYFTMKSGSLTISGTGDDAIQTDYKDSENRDEEDTGTITVQGGSIRADVTATAAKGLKAEGDVLIKGGAVNISVAGGGKWDSDKAKTKASACISADGAFTMSGGEIALKATGAGGKGISADGDLTVEDGKIDIETSGGIYAYINGTEYNNYTGNTHRLDSDQKSSPKGIKADGNIFIHGGTIHVVTSGNGAEGIESKAELTIDGGTINIQSTDDGINSSSHMYIKGGDITVVATANDGLDSNGNLYISGGTVRAFGAGAPECGLDANEEEGYSVYFTGGLILAAGGGNSVPSSSESTQPYLTCSASLSAGITVSVRSGDSELFSFIVPDNYSGSSQGGNRPWAPGGGPGGRPGQGGSVLLSGPGLASGSTYTIVAGTTSTTAIAQLKR